MPSVSGAIAGDGLFRLSFTAAALLAPLFGQAARAAPAAIHPDIQIRHVFDTGSDRRAMRLARNPASGAFYFLLNNGGIYRLTLPPGGGASARLVHDAAATGVAAPQGFAFGPDGALYVAGNRAQGKLTVGIVRRGIPAAPDGDARDWSTLAETEPYPLSAGFDHLVNGIVVSPDGRRVYVNSGSRTDHGEVQTNGGAFPGLRDAPLTAVIFRLPADGRDLLIRNDEAEAAPYIFARGLRNSFDLAFSPEGELFAGENSGDRDDNEELNWIREGRHYGFPWRIGTGDTPQRFPGYDPDADRLVNRNYTAYRRGWFHDDPTFPPPPAGVEFAEPVMNLGPDADSFRDPQTGAIRDASALGIPLGTFTAHRSPLGLVFDTEGALGGEFQGGGFILAWTRGNAAGDAASGPFGDAGEDLLHLELRREGDNYSMTSRRIAAGFLNPVDAEIAGHRIYVLEQGASGAIWEVTLPAAPRFRRGFINSDGELDIADAVAALLYLFGGLAIGCADAADLDDDGRLAVPDAVHLLTYLFLEGPPPAPPFEACGPDPTPDAAANPSADLGCASPAGCG